MKKIFYIALTIVLGLAGTSCDREKLTYDSEPGEISGKPGLSIFLLSMPYPIMT